MKYLKQAKKTPLCTSEGEDTQQTIIPNDNIIVKHNIKSSPLQTQSSTPNKQHNFYYKNKTTPDTFNKLLKEHHFEVQKLKKFSYTKPKTISIDTYQIPLFYNPNTKKY